VISDLQELENLDARMLEARELIEDDDPEISALAAEEIKELEPIIEKLKQTMVKHLIPPDPLFSKDAILEIRAGTGGEEAALFAADLLRMYTKYAESMGWSIERMSTNVTELGGIKEIVLAVRGPEAYGMLRHESGVHRVQRVPTTETQGRVHTSAVSVAVLPEAEEIDIEIESKDLRIDVYRSSGPGGQSVNTTDSAVRITHIPSGITVQCQDEKSQHKNKSKAMKVLRSRLLDKAIQERDKKLAADRRSQVGSGDRSAKIRTYNFPQSRVTDHRISLTVYKLDQILAGHLDGFIEALQTHYAERQLSQLELTSSS
jgi:peptide chain release factor 1